MALNRKERYFFADEVNGEFLCNVTKKPGKPMACPEYVLYLAYLNLILYKSNTLQNKVCMNSRSFPMFVSLISTNTKISGICLRT